MMNPIKLTVVALLSAGALAMPAEAAANDVANVQATADVAATADAARGPWGYGYGRDWDNDWNRRHRGYRYRDWNRYGGYGYGRDHEYGRGYGRGYKRDVAAADAATAENAEAATAATDATTAEDARRPWGYGRRGGWGRRYGGWGGYFNPTYYAPSTYYPSYYPSFGYGYGW